MPNRRQTLFRCLKVALAGGLTSRVLAGSTADPPQWTLGFSTYGLPGRSTVAALQAIARAGYDSVEIAVTLDRDADPQQQSAAERMRLRAALIDSGLALTSLMENLRPLGPAAQHAADLERLKRAVELGHELSPAHPPLVQSVLGGRNWEQERTLVRDRIADWVRVAESTRTVVCIKPHRFHAMSTPADALWLIEALGSPPQLKMIFDYSHYLFRDMPLAETVAAALPITAQIAVKDAVTENDTVTFALPGSAGTVDYPSLLEQFHAGGFRGDVCVEVSAQLWKQPDYQGDAALTTCYEHLARAFVEAQVPRRKEPA
jgi:inosose dehydratase